MANRLADSTSPYLLQHKDNPVDWWPWCPEAFDEARRLNRPVLLSVGYAACHWCHVMAHESFEDPQIAAAMNAQFVCVKVDREERPDVDAVYMDAVQALTGQGGWPMTVFCTPEGAPFYAGTYFPPADKLGMPGFPRILDAVARAWRERPDEIVRAGQQIVARLSALTELPGDRGEPDPALLDSAARRLHDEADLTFGGFGGAPKFPPALTLEFLLRHHARTADPKSLSVVDVTCDRMARGGIYDQVGGGFARYSVDERWMVPHFEKMLYDNALLLRLYTHHWRTTANNQSRRIALGTAEFILRELRTDQGGFASSLDADSDGGEGRYYVWTGAELDRVLGAEEGARAAALFGVTPTGNFEHGSSVLQLAEEPADCTWFADVRRRLLQARDARVRPARDDKVVTAWNGLTIAALCEAGLLFDRADLVDAARHAAELLLGLHRRGEGLLRTSRDGTAGPSAGVLEDYADLADGLLALHQADGASRWLTESGALLGEVVARFGDGSGGFFDTAADAEALIRRPRDPTDNVTPSGAAAACGALLTYAALTGEAWARESCRAALAGLRPLIAGHPRFAGWAAAVGEALVAGPLEVAVVGAPELARVARLATSPGAVVVTGGDGSPLLRDRPAGAAYVCRQFVCAAPTRDPATLAGQVGAWV